MRVMNSTNSALVSLAVVLALGTLIMPAWLVDQMLSGLALGLAVLGVMMLWRAGLISFGHGLYFGIGAYTTAFLHKYYGITEFFLALGAGAVSAGLLGAILGFLLRRYRGIFFAMLNLGLSMILYAVLVESSVFGSTDGFSVPPATFFGSTLGTAEFRVVLLLLLTTVVFGAALALHRYLRSTLGQLTTAIRDNEIRVEYLGFSAPLVVHYIYTLSAVLAGSGGVFMALAVGQVDPDSMVNWRLSGELVFIAVFSGSGSVIAPLVGAVLFVLIRSYALEVAPDGWHIIMGAVLLITIILLPGGVWSLVQRFRRPLVERA